MSTHDPNARLLGVVLCGGKSSRMGRDKSLLHHPHGGRFIDHAIAQLQPLCDEVCLAGSAAGEIPAIDCECLSDDVTFQGPITGIVKALKHADEKHFDACLVTPVDMPWLTTHELAALKNKWQRIQQFVCGISDSDRLQPLVAIYPTETLSALVKLSQSEDRSLYRWIKTQPHQTILLPGETSRNVNQPDDL